MNREEKIAQEYLSRLSLGQVIHEPDGNVPPDFKVGPRLAVEVRRLNQQRFTSHYAEGLEKVGVPIIRTLKKVLSSYDAAFQGTSYLMGVQYGRPSDESTAQPSKLMKGVIDKFLKGDRKVPCTLKVSSKIWLSISASPVIPNRMFYLAGNSDLDSGGWLIPMYVQNITYCIQEKKIKVAPYRQKYPTWWLFLVDTIGWGLDSEDEREVRSGITDLGGFNKILIVDSLGKNTLMTIT